MPALATRTPATTPPFSLPWATSGTRLASSGIVSCFQNRDAIKLFNQAETWGRSAVGSAPRWHRGGHGFEPRRLHQIRDDILRLHPSESSHRSLLHQTDF